MFKIIIQLFILTALFTQCSGPSSDFEKQTELQYLDTLDARLEVVRQLLSKVNYEDISERKEIIEHNYELLEERFVEKKIIPDAQTMQIVDEYKALEKLYERTLANYKNIAMEMEELHIQVKTLKESANSKDYNKETFKKYFNQEKKDVLKLYELSQETIKPCLETESVFMRRQGEVVDMIEKMK
ncbi:MAG: hypothetical protein V4613_13500 [Bacteroidota bacterium]